MGPTGSTGAAGPTGPPGVPIMASGQAVGAPTTGTWAAGALTYDGAGAVWLCTAAGTPGTWLPVVATIDANGVMTLTATKGANTFQLVIDPNASNWNLVNNGTVKVRIDGSGNTYANSFNKQGSGQLVINTGSGGPLKFNINSAATASIDVNGNFLTLAGGQIGWTGGTVLLQGAGVPAAGLGANGNFYFNNTAATPATAVYQKQAGAWVAIGASGGPAARGRASNDWFAPFQGTGQPVVNYLASNNFLNLWPWLADSSFNLKGICIEQTNAATTGGYNLVVYADNGNGYPGALLYDSGLIAGSATLVGRITGTLGSPIPIVAGGLYWIGFCWQGTGSGQGYTCPSEVPPISLRYSSGGASGSLNNYQSGYQSSQSTQPMPATFPAGQSPGSNVFVKFGMQAA